MIYPRWAFWSWPRGRPWSLKALGSIVMRKSQVREVDPPLGFDTRDGLRAYRLRAHVGNAHMAREVAIGKPHPRTAEASRVDPLKMETRLERHALNRRADCLASDPERSRRQRYRACRSRAAELDGADDQAVIIDAALAARASKQLNAKSLPVTKRRAASGVRLSARAEPAVNEIKTTIASRVITLNPPVTCRTATCCSTSSAANCDGDRSITLVRPRNKGATSWTRPPSVARPFGRCVSRRIRLLLSRLP
jgi:hypothetical protein